MIGRITALGSGSEGAGIPESMAGEVRPRPVAQMTMESPGCTGLVGVTYSPLSARVMVARPVSGPAAPVWKTLGAADRIEKLKLSLMPPGVRRVIWALPSTLKGNCPLIRSEEHTSELQSAMH